MFSIAVHAAGIVDFSGASGGTPNTLQDLELVFGNVLRAAIPGAGIVLFVVLLLAGVNYIAAGSDPKKAESARHMATYAVAGLILIAMAFLIIQVIALFTGVDNITTFTIFRN